MDIIIFIFICLGHYLEVAYMTLLERKIMAAIERSRGPIKMVKFFYFSFFRWIKNCFNFLKQSILSGLALGPETKIISMDFFGAIIIASIVGGATIAIMSTFFPESMPLPKNLEPTNLEPTNSTSTDACSSLSENVNAENTNTENTNTSIFNIYHKIVENIFNIFASNVNVENTNTSNVNVENTNTSNVNVENTNTSNVINSETESDSDKEIRSTLKKVIDIKGPANLYNSLSADVQQLYSETTDESQRDNDSKTNDESQHDNTNTSNEINSDSADKEIRYHLKKIESLYQDMYNSLSEYFQQNNSDSEIQSVTDTKGQMLNKHLDKHLQNSALSIDERDIIYDFMQIIEDKDEDKSNDVINDEISSSSSSSSDKKGKKPVNKPVNKSPISESTASEKKPTVKKKTAEKKTAENAGSESTASEKKTTVKKIKLKKKTSTEPTAENAGSETTASTASEKKTTVKKKTAENAGSETTASTASEKKPTVKKKTVKKTTAENAGSESTASTASEKKPTVKKKTSTEPTAENAGSEIKNV